LFDKVSGKRELHEVEGAEHTFREESHLEEIKILFGSWIDNIQSS